MEALACAVPLFSKRFLDEKWHCIAVFRFRNFTGILPDSAKVEPRLKSCLNTPKTVEPSRTWTLMKNVGTHILQCSASLPSARPRQLSVATYKSARLQPDLNIAVFRCGSSRSAALCLSWFDMERSFVSLTSDKPLLTSQSSRSTLSSLQILSLIHANIKIPYTCVSLGNYYSACKH